MEVNKTDGMKVNNYKELSDAIKKLFVEYMLTTEVSLCIDYQNKIIDDEKIISLACPEHIEDFCNTLDFFFDKELVNYNKFFKRIKSGRLIKCKFPAIVNSDGILEFDNIKEHKDYEYYPTKEFFEENYSLEKISRKIKKNSYLYLAVDKNCFMPIKKSKEETISFLKKNKFCFPKNLNDISLAKNERMIVCKKHSTWDPFTSMVIITNSAKNDKVKMFKDFFNL